MVHKIHGSVCFWYNRENKTNAEADIFGIFHFEKYKWQLFGHNSYCRIDHTETLAYRNTYLIYQSFLIVIPKISTVY